MRGLPLLGVPLTSLVRSARNQSARTYLVATAPLPCRERIRGRMGGHRRSRRPNGASSRNQKDWFHPAPIHRVHMLPLGRRRWIALVGSHRPTPVRSRRPNGTSSRNQKELVSPAGDPDDPYPSRVDHLPRRSLPSPADRGGSLRDPKMDHI